MTDSNSPLYVPSNEQSLMGALQLVVTWAKASGTAEIYDLDQITEITMQVSKYILSFFVD